MGPFIVTLWWIFFWGTLGLCIGSFLNVVIYRLPRNIPLSDPVWSACPYCSARIRWYDNLPLVSFLSLRGRCRDCFAPISSRYFVVEALMAMIVLLLLDSFFVQQTRIGLSDSPIGINEHLSHDWPIFVAHVILFACLVGMSAIDLEHYWVDVRFTNWVTIAGFVLHAIWTPTHATDWHRPSDTTALVSLLALGGVMLVWLMTICQPGVDSEDDLIDEFQEEEENTDAFHRPAPGAAPSYAFTLEPSRLAVVVMFGALLLMVVLQLTAGAGVLEFPPHWRVVIPLGLLFIFVVREGSVVRSSDQEIMDAIEEERHGARRMVLGELLWFAPAVVFSLVAFRIMANEGPTAIHFEDTMQSATRFWGFTLFRQWSPLMGLATAASGFVIAGAIGWAVRIVFTLVLGKEAFGTGDIHLMAAAGCVAGWPIVLLGFILTCGLAVAGWLMTLPFKRSRAIPLGPWLSLSFLIVVIYYDYMLKWPVIARCVTAMDMLFFNNSQASSMQSIS